MFKKLLTLTLLVSLSTSSYMTVGADTAQAGHRGSLAAGIAGGLIGLGLLSAYAHARDHVYYRGHDYERYPEVCHRGPRECGWVGRRCFENPWGEVICRGGRWSCWRETYCD